MNATDILKKYHLPRIGTPDYTWLKAAREVASRDAMAAMMNLAAGNKIEGLFREEVYEPFLTIRTAFGLSRSNCFMTGSRAYVGELARDPVCDIDIVILNEKECTTSDACRNLLAKHFVPFTNGKVGNNLKFDFRNECYNLCFLVSQDFHAWQRATNAMCNLLKNDVSFPDKKARIAVFSAFVEECGGQATQVVYGAPAGMSVGIGP
jgi:hypothetical protein